MTVSSVAQLSVGLVCLDVDGTLIGMTPEIHPRVLDQVPKVAASGVQLAVCTGRPALGPTRGYAEQLNPTGWHIFQGGASLLNLQTGESRSRPLSEQALAALCDLKAKHGWVLELYSDSDYVCDQPVDDSEASWLAVSHANLIGLEYQPRPLDSLQGQLVRAQWVVTDAQLPAVMASASSDLNYASATTPSLPGMHFVSVTAQGVDKCSAIQLLAEQIVGCSLEQTMMVGDGQNDISALKLVGYPVAMANGHPELLAVSRFRAGDVKEGGVADALLLVQELNQPS